MLFITADHHFCHKNIIKYCNRPFETVEEMDKTMIEKWNRVVDLDDTVIHLGDFALTSRAHIKEIREQLNGEIYILIGNHDRAGKLRNAGFEEVITSQTIKKDNFILSHNPLNKKGIPSLNVGVDNFDFYPIPFPTTKQQINLCGHVHDLWTVRCNNG